MKVKKYTGTPDPDRMQRFYNMLPPRFEGADATHLYIETFYTCKDIAYRDLAALYQLGKLTRHKLPTDKRKYVYEKIR